MVRYRGLLPGVWAWLKKIFTRLITPSYLVVEIEKGIQIAAGADNDAIALLKNHPGFLALTNRMRLKKAALKAALEQTRHDTIRDVDFIQSGLYWLGFLELEVKKAVQDLQTKAAPKLAVNEVEEFEKVRAAIESVRVGTTSS